MKNKLTFALLSAGLFLSTKSFAAGECLAYVGSIVDFISFPAGSSCPEITSRTVSGVECEVVKTGEFLCSIFEDGSQTISGPWKYTGNPFGGETGNPVPLPPLTPVRPIDWQEPALNNNGEAVNSNLVKLSESFKTLSESLNNTITDSAANQRNIAARVDKVNTDVQAALSFNTNQTAQQIQTLQSSLNSAQASIKDNDDDNFQTLYDQAERHNGVTQQGISDIKQQANQLQNIENQIEGVMGTVTTANNYVQEFLPDMASANSDSFGQVLGGLAVVEQRLDSLNSGGGGGTDLTDTNNLIRETIGNIQGLNSSLNYIGQNTSRTNGLLDSVTYSMSDLYGETAMQSMLIYNGNTQTAEKLDAINETLKNGTGDGSDVDFTETNEKLDTIINNTGATGNNVVTSGQATQQAVAASGQQVTDAVNALGNAFEAGSGQNTGPTLCTGDECYKGKSWVTPKYPEGMTSIYETHKAAFQDSSVHEYLQGFNPIISGNAPTSWQFCVNVGFANLGCHSLELPPYILSFVRLIILITAGFLCRRLIFGG